MRPASTRTPKAVGSTLLLLFPALVLVGCSDASSREAPAGEELPIEEISGERPRADDAVRKTVAAGTAMTFTVAQSISTDTHAPGDRFTAELDADVTGSDGDTVLPRGTSSRWIVTEATTEGDQALLVLELESIRANGTWVPMKATVSDAELESDDRDSGTETAAKIGVGAAAGAVIGQIVGGSTESTLAGAGVGAAVGAVVALSTRGGRATLPAGSRLTVELDESLIVS